MNRLKDIFVIGDLIIDEDIICDAVGLSLESPTLKCTHNNTEKRLGGSGNVVMNLSELNSRVGYMSICTDDDVKQILRKKNISYFGLCTDKKTTVKQRYYVNRGDLSYKYMQINYSDNDPIATETENDACLILSEVLPNYQAVIISDYKCGLLTEKLIKHIISVCDNLLIPVIVNTQISDWGNKKTAAFDQYVGCDLIVANEQESKYINIDSPYVTTLGAEGSKFVCKKRKITVYSEGVKADVKDTCGAGDAFTAMISTLPWKENIDKALYHANLWASKSTEHIGASPPSFKKYKKCLKQLQLN